MLCISTHGNSAFRTEELECVYRNFNEKTHRVTKGITLQFKSGNTIKMYCKTLKESEALFDLIINIIKEDYKTLAK